MERGGLHDPPAYALDALDDHERDEFEAHLAECDDCRAELADFRETASMLAHAVEGPAPPDALREHPRRCPARASFPERRRPPPATGARLTAIAAAAAVAAAIGLGVWAASLSSSLDAERSALAEQARAAAILADDNSTRVRMGERGELVRSPDGDAVMVVRNLAPAPEGQTYERG